MKYETDPDGRIVLSYDGTGLARLVFAVAALLLALAAHTYLTRPAKRERLIGSIAGFITCTIAGVVLIERSRFEFHPWSRTILWRRRWAWSAHEGVTPFDRVGAVAVQRPIGDRGVPSRRLSLLLKEGGEIPLTDGYKPDVSGEFLELADKLRAIVGLEQGGDGVLRWLVREGRIADAVRHAREQGHVTLAEAKRRVDELHEQRKSA